MTELMIIGALVVLASGSAAVGWTACLLHERSTGQWRDGYEQGYADGLADAD